MPEAAKPRVAIPYDYGRVRTQAKKLGGRWLKEVKEWEMPSEEAAEEVRRLIAETDELVRQTVAETEQAAKERHAEVKERRRRDQALLDLKLEVTGVLAWEDKPLGRPADSARPEQADIPADLDPVVAYSDNRSLGVDNLRVVFVDSERGQVWSLTPAGYLRADEANAKLPPKRPADAWVQPLTTARAERIEALKAALQEAE